MEPGVMLSAVREYSVKGQRIFMQNLRLEEANALSGKGLRRSRHYLQNATMQFPLCWRVGERKGR